MLTVPFDLWVLLLQALGYFLAYDSLKLPVINLLVEFQSGRGTASELLFLIHSFSHQDLGAVSRDFIWNSSLRWESTFAIAFLHAT
jgi:hypothetical protein